MFFGFKVGTSFSLRGFLIFLVFEKPSQAEACGYLKKTILERTHKV
jgi:hypothetical protein